MVWFLREPIGNEPMTVVVYRTIHVLQPERALGQTNRGALYDFAERPASRAA